LSTSGKLALGAAGILAGSTGLFYYGAIKYKGQSTQERPGNIVKLGDLNEFNALEGVKKVHYQAVIQDAWITKSINSFVYVNSDANGDLHIMSPSCTHLGCNIEPAPEAERGALNGLFFRCPCHGAEFDIEGNAVKIVSQGLDTFQPIIAGSSVYIDILSPIKGSIVDRAQ
jgi:menaquinol-cytochrome c reductase iron-sulfur subunit